LDASSGRLLRDLSPKLGVPMALDENSGFIYFAVRIAGRHTTLNEVNPRTWKIVRTVLLPSSDVLSVQVVGRRFRRVLVARRLRGAHGAITDEVTVLCADTSGCGTFLEKRIKHRSEPRAASRDEHRSK
jgi:hypothetical protein